MLKDESFNIIETVYKSIEKVYYTTEFLVNLSVLSVSVVKEK